MKFALALATLMVAVPALASPYYPRYELERRQTPANNCTQYCSVDAGCVCTVRPSDCDQFYTVQPDDTCLTIANKFNNFTVTQLYKWNPDIGQTCFGLQAYVPICVATPWYTYVAPFEPPYGTHETPAQVPVPIMPGIPANCTNFEFAGPNTTYAELAQENGFTAQQYASWNGNAVGPWSGYWTCVKA